MATKKAMRRTIMMAGALALSVSALNANAAAIIKTGNTYLGVNDHGELNVSESDGTFGDINPRGSVVGLTWGGLGDATSPGCLCEGWGAGANGVGASANRAIGGVTNLTLDSRTCRLHTNSSLLRQPIFSRLRSHWQMSGPVFLTTCVIPAPWTGIFPLMSSRNT